jgi:hypothetical protein
MFKVRRISADVEVSTVFHKRPSTCNLGEPLTELLITNSSTLLQAVKKLLDELLLESGYVVWVFNNPLDSVA